MKLGISKFEKHITQAVHHLDEARDALRKAKKLADDTDARPCGGDPLAQYTDLKRVKWALRLMADMQTGPILMLRIHHTWRDSDVLVWLRNWFRPWFKR